MGVDQNGWFTMENDIKMNNLAVPLFQDTSISLLGGAVPLTHGLHDYRCRSPYYNNKHGGSIPSVIPID